jgi:hypothetical protein
MTSQRTTSFLTRDQRCSKESCDVYAIRSCICRRPTFTVPGQHKPSLAWWLALASNRSSQTEIESMDTLCSTSFYRALWKKRPIILHR